MMEDQSSTSSHTGTAPGSSEKRRRRPPLACIDCRRRKVRCDRKMPCQNCIRARRAASCAYVPDDRIEPREGTQGFHDGVNGRSADKDDVVSMPFPSPHTTQSCGRTPPDGSGRSLTSGGVDARGLHQGRHAGAERRSDRAESSSQTLSALLVERVRQLEQQLAQVQRDARVSPSQQEPVRQSHPDYAECLGTEHYAIRDVRDAVFRSRPNENGAKGVPHNPVMMAKNRYFGSSHWLHGVILFPRSSFLISLLENFTSDKTSEAYKTIAEAKSLGRAIKAARIPRLHSLQEIGQHIPSRDLADSLLNAYFRTFETVYRILHIPSFRLEYGRYWQNPKTARGAFVVQLQLCLALGAVVRDETFSLRNLAVRWVFEARLWLIMPPSEKSRVNLSGLQVRCLIHLARQVCGVSPDLIWCEAGALMRMACFIGLHRDPEKLPKMSLLAAETRRRLWATILEILVQSSMECGGPPLVAEHDYDVKPPGNYNDEDLLGDDDASGRTPAPHPVATMTDASVQIALLSTMGVRLRIASYLNEFQSNTAYDKTLALNSELTAASRGLDTLLRVYQSQSPGLLNFQLRETEHVIQRYFLSLHLPWLGLAKDDPRYFLSRKVCVETGLRNQATAKAHGYLGTANGAELDDFGRLLICAAGSHRYTGTQCLTVLTIQLFWELEEHRQTLKNLGVGMTNFVPPLSTPFSSSSASSGLSPGGNPGHEMLDALRNASKWMRARIQAGEVNVKGYLFGRAMLSEVEGLQRGIPDDELRTLVYETTREAAEDSMSIVKELHARIPIPPQQEGGEVVMPDAPGAAPADGDRAEGDNAQATTQNGAGMDAPFPEMSDDFATIDPGSNGEMSDWEWDMLQDPSSNFNIRLGSMGFMFGDLDAY